MDFIMVAISGAAGAVVRYLGYVAGRAWYPQTQFPYTTLLINTVGCLLAGVVMTIVARHAPQYRNLYLLGAVGFLGSFTTFSTFGFETLELIRGGQTGVALTNAFANVTLGVIAVWIGSLCAPH